MGIKLTEVIAVWDILHVKDVGDLDFCALESAVDRVWLIDKVVGVKNDIPKEQPSLPVEF